MKPPKAEDFAMFTTNGILLWYTVTAGLPFKHAGPIFFGSKSRDDILHGRPSCPISAGDVSPFVLHLGYGTAYS